MDKPLWHIPVAPCPAPRMTQRDRWKKRPCVQRYHHFRDGINRFLREHAINHSSLPERFTAVFYIPFPKSKSKKWKKANVWEGHKAKPDTDNRVKAFLDAWFRDADTDDSHVWDVRGVKVWCPEGQGAIEVYESEKLGFETNKK